MVSALLLDPRFSFAWCSFLSVADGFCSGKDLTDKVRNIERHDHLQQTLGKTDKKGKEKKQEPGGKFSSHS